MIFDARVNEKTHPDRSRCIQRRDSPDRFRRTRRTPPSFPSPTASSKGCRLDHPRGTRVAFAAEAHRHDVRTPAHGGSNRLVSLTFRPIDPQQDGVRDLSARAHLAEAIVGDARGHACGPGPMPPTGIPAPHRFGPGSPANGSSKSSHALEWPARGRREVTVCPPRHAADPGRNRYR